MPAYRFSSLEIKAMEYFARMPELDDEKIAKLLQISKSEAKKLRRKLSKILQLVVVPNYGLLGWELMFVIYSTMPVKKTPAPERLEGCTHAYLTQEFFLAIGFAENYSELLRLYEKLCLELAIPKEQLYLLIFSNELITTFRFFDYVGIIEKEYFGLPTKVAASFPVKKKDFDSLTKRTLLGIVQHPHANEETLSKKIGADKSIVKRKLTLLKKYGYYTQTLCVSPEYFGYTGFAFYHLNVESGQGLAEILEDPNVPAFLAISDDKNGFILMPYRNPEEIFHFSVILNVRRKIPQGVSILNYGYFQYDELTRIKEHDYITVLRRNRNFMFGGKIEGVGTKPEGRECKVSSRNRR